MPPEPDPKRVIAFIALTATGTPPAPRRLHTAIYDPVLDRMIVFGGFDGGFYNDVWALSLSGTPGWARVFPAGGAPTPRAGHAALYDPVGQRMIVFGGYDGVSAPAQRRSDVWALSLSGAPAWSEITPGSGGPSARSSHRAVYDPVRQRMVVFGGTDPAFRNDVWALSLPGVPAWSQILPAGAPPEPREEHSAIYDPIGDRMVVFGGIDAGAAYGDTWGLGLDGVPAWQQLFPIGFPPGSWGHAAVYDRSHDEMVLFGGYSYRVLNDTWILDWARNRSPDCSSAFALDAELSPPNHRLVPVIIGGVSDPEGDPVNTMVTTITQDEPVSGPAGRYCPDGVVENGNARVRAERDGRNGRVYAVSFEASDGRGGFCTGVVEVCVPLGRRCIDDGQTASSLGPCPTPVRVVTPYRAPDGMADLPD